MNTNILLLFFLVLVSSTPLVFAQDDRDARDLEIEIYESDIIIIVVSISGGIVSALIQMEKSRQQAANVNNNLVFERTKGNIGGKILLSIVIASITGVSLGIAAAAEFDKLTLLGMVLVFIAAVGSSSISKSDYTKVKP